MFGYMFGNNFSKWGKTSQKKKKKNPLITKHYVCVYKNKSYEIVHRTIFQNIRD